jgi:hypothetical protein
MATIDFKYHVNDEVNEIVDEKGNSAIMFRKLAWGDGEEKLELRKWYVDIDKETPAKGVTFLTEDGPHNLTHILVKKGFGDTEKILGELKSRDDFDEALSNTIGKKKVKEIKDKESASEEIYYDPKEMLGVG